MRNTLKYVSDKDRKLFAADLKTIYQAPTEEKALEALERGTKKWSEKYPNSMKSWHQNWDAIVPIFKFSTTVRKVIYTTNAIESLNATYRKLNRQRSVFPSDTALLKALYLSTFEATKKWTMPIRNWGQVYGELSLMYEGRLRCKRIQDRSDQSGIRLVLTYAVLCGIYKPRLNAHREAFSPAIIIEELLLQRFLHTLD